MEDTFVISDKTPTENNIVYITIKEASPGDIDSTKKDEEKIKISTEESDLTPYLLTIVVKSSEDSTTLLNDIPVYLGVSELYSLVAKTGELGLDGIARYYVSNSVYDIYVVNKTVEGIIITQDTTVYVYIDKNDYSKVYFNFYYGEERFNPESVDYIDIYYYRGTNNLKYPRVYPEIEGNTKNYSNRPVICANGHFKYSFQLDERNYEIQGFHN